MNTSTRGVPLSNISNLQSSTNNARKSLVPSKNNGIKESSTTFANRQSLAAQQQPRMSMGIPNNNIIRTPSKPNSRMSLAPNTITRNSMAAPGRNSSFYKTVKGLKDDPRGNLKEKSVYTAEAKKIIAYLTEQGFTEQLSLKAIVDNVQTRLMQSIIYFLFKQIDPMIHITNPQEDVPNWLNRLNYPFTIQKSALQTMGQPHSWGPVVGSLSWLVEVCRFVTIDRERGDEDYSFVTGDRGLNRMTYFEHLASAYNEFLCGDDSKNSQVLMIQGLFNEIGRSVNEEVAYLDHRYQKLSQVLIERNNQPNKLQILKSKKEEKELELATNQTREEELKKYLVTMENSNNESVRNIELLKSEVDIFKTESEQLKEFINNQEISATEAEKINQEILQYQQLLNKLSTERQEVEKIEDQKQVMLAKKTEIYESLLKDFNEFSAKNNFTYSENSKGLKSSENSIDEVHDICKKLIRPELQLKNQNINQESIDLVDENLNLVEKLEKREEEEQYLHRSIELAEKELTEMKQYLKNEKVKLVDAVKLMEKSQEEATKEIQKESNALKSEHEIHIIKFEERKRLHEALVEQYKTESKQTIKWLHNCLTMIVNHKASIDEHLKEQVRISENTLRKLNPTM